MNRRAVLAPSFAPRAVSAERIHRVGYLSGGLRTPEEQKTLQPVDNPFGIRVSPMC